MRLICLVLYSIVFCLLSDIILPNKIKELKNKNKLYLTLISNYFCQYGILNQE